MFHHSYGTMIDGQNTACKEVGGSSINVSGVKVLLQTLEPLPERPAKTSTCIHIHVDVCNVGCIESLTFYECSLNSKNSFSLFLIYKRPWHDEVRCIYRNLKYLKIFYFWYSMLCR